MIAFRKIGLIFLLVTLISACSTVTIRPHGGAKDNSTPDYLDSKPFYFGGPVGKHQVNVNEACEGSEVTQMQSTMTASDWILSFVTFGIYTPRTAKIWCGADQ